MSRKQNLHQEERDNFQRQFFFSAIYIIVSLALLFGVRALLTSPQIPQASPYSEFLSRLEADEITEVLINETRIIWTVGDTDNQQIFVSQRPPHIDESGLIDRLESAGVTFDGVQTPKFWQGLLSWLLPIIAIFLIWRLLINRLPGQHEALTFGQNRARIWDQGTVDVTFEQVAGVDESVTEMREIVDFLKTPEKYERLGGRIPKGILLIGPPGTGKTLLARATAGEASVPFFSLSGADFVEMFAGVGAARVRDLFKKAREKAPCIIFIDELDTIGRSRSGSQSPITHEEREQTLNQLLVEMDGFDSSVGVIIMAATNRPDVLDPALLRPGRFDRQIMVDRPDRRGRRDILAIHAREIKVADDVDLDMIAARTPGFAGAELENLVNEAALLAARRNADEVELQDFDDAIDRVMMGLERENRALSESEREIVAYHELGHALVASLLSHTDPVHKVSIVPRGIGALGITMQMPVEDRYLMNELELHDRIAVLLGGRAAEDVMFGHTSTGAADDLQKATDLARRMVAEYGMSDEIGPVALVRRNGLSSVSVSGHSDQLLSGPALQSKVDAEVKRIIEQNYGRARDILENIQIPLEELARELLQVEDIDGETLQKRLVEFGVLDNARDQQTIM